MSLVELIRFEPLKGAGTGTELTAEERALAEEKQQEYQRGYQEGMAEMEHKHQQDTAAKAQHILSQIVELNAGIKTIEGRVECQAGDVAAGAINSILPELSKLGMAGEMALAVRNLIGRLEPPHLRISAPEVLIKAIRSELEEAGETVSIPLEFEIDEAASEGSAKLEWPQGNAGFDHGETLARVTRSLEKLMSPGPDKPANPTLDGASQ